MAVDGACELHATATFPADTAILFDDGLDTEQSIFNIKPLNAWWLESHVDCQEDGGDLACDGDDPKEFVIRNSDDERRG